MCPFSSKRTFSLIPETALAFEPFQHLHITSINNEIDTSSHGQPWLCTWFNTSKWPCLTALWTKCNQSCLRASLTGDSAISDSVSSSSNLARVVLFDLWPQPSCQLCVKKRRMTLPWFSLNTPWQVPHKDLKILCQISTVLWGTS